MKIEQFVMAYGIEQDRIRSLLPEGFASLRPVLRINAEITDNSAAYLEFNTAVETDGFRGWLNIGCKNNVCFERNCGSTVFSTDELEITFTGAGIQGGCPAEKDNDGCIFLTDRKIRKPEIITENKEFCDCVFRWKYDGGAHGKSEGKTLPAIPTETIITYPKEELTTANAAAIPCRQVLGAYKVIFEREVKS